MKVLTLLIMSLLVITIVPIYAQEDGGFDSGSDSWGSGDSGDSWSSDSSDYGSEYEPSYSDSEPSYSDNDSWGSDESDSWKSHDSWSETEPSTSNTQITEYDNQLPFNDRYGVGSYKTISNNKNYDEYYGYGAYYYGNNIWWNWWMFTLLFSNMQEHDEQQQLKERAWHNSTDVLFDVNENKFKKAGR